MWKMCVRHFSAWFIFRFSQLYDICVLETAAVMRRILQ
jgi:hypothetical protein